MVGGELVVCCRYTHTHTDTHACLLPFPTVCHMKAAYTHLFQCQRCVISIQRLQSVCRAVTSHNLLYTHPVWEHKIYRRVQPVSVVWLTPDKRTSQRDAVLLICALLTREHPEKHLAVDWNIQNTVYYGVFLLRKNDNGTNCCASSYLL